MGVRFPTWLQRVLVFLLVVGIVFRFVNLNHKVYWHDEAYTSLRAAGYTRWEIDQELFQNRVVVIGELQKFQQIKPGSTIADTIHSLAQEDPQHPPLYFLMARVWMQWFGGSLTASRLLPVFLSLFTLPFMYALAWELFASHEIALLATTFLALSPFDVLFAQTARQYGLLTVFVIASQWLLLRALRVDTKGRNNQFKITQSWDAWQSWGLYALSVALGLYTHPFFGLTVVGQAVYLGLEALLKPPQVSWQRAWARAVGILRNFCLAIAVALILYAPWLFVLVTNYERAMATTDWARFSPGIGTLLNQWMLSFTALFIDLYTHSRLLELCLRLPIVLLIGVSIYTICRRCDRSTWLLIVTSILVPFLLLVLSDLIAGGKRSTVSRYLISCYPGIQLAVAYFLGAQLSLRTRYKSRIHRNQTLRQPVQTFWQQLKTFFQNPSPLSLTPYATAYPRSIWYGVLILVVTASLISLSTSASADAWWNKDLSYNNPQVARDIKASPSPIVISDIGDDFTNTGDMISLSYLLNKDIPFIMMSDDLSWIKTERFRSQLRGRTAFTYRPTQKLHQALEQSYGPMQLLPPERFWRLRQN
ncbi:MAG: glycosyltransferase family 39 protein [Kovacikia sp.]